MSNPLLAAARQSHNSKMLSNLPSHKYMELKDEQMLPTASQMTVQHQALQRLANQMSAIELENVKRHNQMVDNLYAQDTAQ